MSEMTGDIRRSFTQLIILGLALCLCSCEGAEKPTPEAAKRFLKLRGYEFDEQSFFKAAAAGDVLAANGFLSAGINPNAQDENSDTALTASAARGDLPMVNALLSGGADINAKGRNNWTALLLALEREHDEAANALAGQPNLDLSAETPKVLPALGTVLSVHNSLVAYGILRGGDAAQRQEFLPRLASGEWLGAYALSEAHAGSDPASMRTRAVRVGDEYRITGTKTWITSGQSADVFILFAVTDPQVKPSRGISAFIVPKTTPGLQVGKREQKMGIRASETTTA